MFRKVDDFLEEWKYITEGTAKILKAIPDDKLGQAVNDEHRTLGRMAWHIATSIPEMMARTGLSFGGPDEKTPVPKTAEEIYKVYGAYAASLNGQIQGNWSDQTLEKEDDMYGMKWKRGFTLRVLINHEIHHRGQMTVLMRQAGLKVPGVFGPSKEEWSVLGMDTPTL